MPRATKSAPKVANPDVSSPPAQPVPASVKPTQLKSAQSKPTQPRPGEKSSISTKEPAKESSFSQSFLDAQKQSLLAERANYTEAANSLRDAAEEMAREMEPGDVQFDEESGEGGTMAMERERDLTLSAQARAAVEEIDLALRRMEDGSYGRCIRCQEPIAEARLKALPYAALCVACKSGGLSRR
ncbi:MAG: TraR/DksA family transcriptional regulator [Acidimicrobiales bacterium]